MLFGFPVFLGGLQSLNISPSNVDGKMQMVNWE